MGVHENLTGAQRTARYRAAKRAQGLRLKQIWLPDLRDPEVRARIEREVASINASEDEAVIMQTLECWNDELLNSLPPYDWGDNPPDFDAPKPK
jgi:Protein  of unknown function (DUF3018)